MYDRVS